MKTNKWLALGAMMIATALTTAWAPSAHAQNGSGVGGGKFSEEEIAIFYGRLKTYFATDEWKGTFPVVQKYNETHREQFIDLMKSVSFKVVNHKVYAPNGDERDCVPMLKDNIRWIECNSDYIPENTLDNQPTLYSFILHEVFVYAGIEEAKGIWLPSSYEESWKMADKANLSLVTLQVWMPGKGKEKNKTITIRQSGFLCLTDLFSNIYLHHRKTTGFYWAPSGDYVFFTYHFPATMKLLADLGDERARSNGKKRTSLKYEFLNLIAKKARAEVLAIGRGVLNQRFPTTAQVLRTSYSGVRQYEWFNLDISTNIDEPFAFDHIGGGQTFSGILYGGEQPNGEETDLACEAMEDPEMMSIPSLAELLKSKPGTVIKQRLSDIDPK